VRSERAAVFFCVISLDVSKGSVHDGRRGGGPIKVKIKKKKPTQLSITPRAPTGLIIIRVLEYSPDLINLTFWTNNDLRFV
jgi:hypothetical protein